MSHYHVPRRSTQRSRGILAGFVLLVCATCAWGQTISVSSVSPATGPEAGGTAVTINGSGFPTFTQELPTEVTSGNVVRIESVRASAGSQIEVDLFLYRGDDVIASGEAGSAVTLELVFDKSVLSFGSAVESDEVDNLFDKSLTAYGSTNGVNVVIMGMNDTEITCYDGGGTLIRPFPLGTFTFDVIGSAGDSSALTVSNLTISDSSGSGGIPSATSQNGYFEVIDPSNPPSEPVVTFGGSAATVTSWDGTSISATTPAGTAGAVDVRVESPYNASNADTLTSAFTYYEEVGSLSVTISPLAARTAGAQWNVDGGAWQNSGTVVSGLSVGNHTVSYKDVTNWDKPSDETVAITYNTTATTSGTYVQHTGNLRVLLEPEAARTTPAWWRLDGGPWQVSGTILTGLAVGEHTVSYLAISGWTKPADATVSITKDTTTTETGTYVQQTGSLSVTIEPEAARTAGAQWRVDGGAWQDSGATLTGVGVGSHTISFSSVTNWATPSDIATTVADSTLTTETGTYTEDFGSLSVTIEPAAARTAGAQWRIDGGAWQDSGATLTGITVGNHTVSYSAIADWDEPADATVTITKDTLTTDSGTYTQHTGSVQVTIEPEAARTAGAQWNIDGGTWQDSDATLTGVTVGSHTLSYKNIAGWDEPANATVTVVKDTLATDTGTYVQQEGSLQVTIEPAAARTAGGQWRVDGGDWQHSGVTLTGLTAGQHTVSYAAVVGWGTPADATVTITDDTLTTETGTYTEPPGAVQITIEPEAARTAGAKWRVDGGAWQVSGATVSDVAVGGHTVAFSTVSGWNAPANITVTVTTGATAADTGTYTVQSSGGCGKSLKRLNTEITEEVLPLSLDAAPEGLVASSASPAIWLAAGEGIDAPSVWATLEGPDGVLAGSTTFVEGTGGGWAIFTPDSPLPAGQTVTLTAGGNTAGGEALEPVAEEFLIDTAKASADAKTPVVAEEDTIEPLPELLAGPVSGVHRIGPAQVFAAPLTVQIPLDEGADLENLAVYYFSESERHRGWYKGVNVQGWMVPESLRIVEVDGQAYAEFEVNHSGVVQVGTEITFDLGAAGTVDVGASGSTSQWLALAGVLLALSATLGVFRMRSAEGTRK